MFDPRSKSGHKLGYGQIALGVPRMSIAEDELSGYTVAHLFAA
jgi:hypothetical protein